MIETVAQGFIHMVKQCNISGLYDFLFSAPLSIVTIAIQNKAVQGFCLFILIKKEYLSGRNKFEKVYIFRAVICHFICTLNSNY